MNSPRTASAFPEFDELDKALRNGPAPPGHFRAALDTEMQALARRFEEGERVERLVAARASLVDGVVIRAFAMHAMPGWERLCLAAVGGYGRGELHPASDIDIMILAPDADLGELRAPFERFLAFLWDIGLEIGHSIRTVEQCRSEALADITVATSLMEARALCGPEALFEQMCAAVAPDRIWPSREFFEAKLREQQARHRRYDDTAYNLEPNVKGSPGGLRDIQMIGWVAQRHFGLKTIDEVVDHGFLTPEEYDALIDGRAFLWKIRFALHLLTGRREDRLLFDHQVKIAQMFGYEDATYTLAVEQLMQRYYRTVMELSRLNEMLLQLLREAILDDPDAAPIPVNERFRIRNGYLEVSSDDVFRRQPSALLELFLLLEEHTGLEGVSAHTIRLLRRYRHLIDEEFRQNPRHHRMFLQLLRAPVGITHELRRMNRYGVLGRYIPAFGRIVGRMQYDLFHTYTVDEHSLFVVSNLRRFALARFDHEFPYCSRIMQSFAKPELAYLGALFHDIAKGRGGDHSTLGAVDAEAFCLEQGLSRYDARLVAWLVKNHLLLSLTAQKKDIADPQVIHEFARTLGDETHLNYLYVLTVADVRATNPKLWNAWKASLFEELYDQTRHALRRGLENPIDRDELIAETRDQARVVLHGSGFDDARIDNLWARFADEHFLRYLPDEIAWHSLLLADRAPDDKDALVAVRQHGERGGTAIFLYTPFAQHNFALITGVLDQLGLNIVDARLSAAADGFSLDSYIVLEDTGKNITEPGRLREIEDSVRRAILRGKDPQVTRRAPRQVRMFSTPTRLTFDTDASNRRTVMELIAADRPGILSEVGKALRECGAVVDAAKITTVGERAEDVFYISDENGRPLPESQYDGLRKRLIDALDPKAG